MGRSYGPPGASGGISWRIPVNSYSEGTPQWPTTVWTASSYRVAGFPGRVTYSIETFKLLVVQLDAVSVLDGLADLVAGRLQGRFAEDGDLVSEALRGIVWVVSWP